MSGGKTALGLDANIGALICYVGNLACGLPLGLIYSIIVIVTDKTNKVVRFHAFQSVFLSVLGFVISIPLYILAGIAVAANSTIIMGIVGLFSLVFMVAGLALFYFWIMAAIKAYGGEIYKIPVVGNFAEPIFEIVRVNLKNQLLNYIFFSLKTRLKILLIFRR